MDNKLISVVSINKFYGSKQVLKSVQLNIYKSEIFGLLGPNGAGKTTLASIIASLHPANSGDILFNGISIYNNLSEYRRSVGYCQQRPNLNSKFTVRQNLEFAGEFFGLSCAQINSRIDELSNLLKLKEHMDYMPEMLSGGYKQRVMLARSIMHKPKLVILDEPTVALDPHIRRQIWQCIKLMRSDGISIILTTHYIDEAQELCDRVCILSNGEIKLIDTPKNLMQSFKQNSLEDVMIEMANQEDSNGY